MSRRLPALLAAVVLPLGLAGAAVATDGPQFTEARFASVQPATIPFVPKMGFLSATWFCGGAPLPAAADGGRGGEVVIANPLDTPLEGTITVFTDADGQAPVVQNVSVPPRDTLIVAVHELQPQGTYVSSMVELGGAAGIVEQRAIHELGAAVSPCANSTSDTWYFADNYTLNDSSEDLVITNPYPDDAIVDIKVATPTGTSADRPNLQGLAVPPQSILVIDEKYLPKEESTLAVGVVARNGRVVVAKAQQYRTERVGYAFSLGAPSVSPQWFFADGEKSDLVYFERYSIYNPGDREVTVTSTVLGVPTDDPEFIPSREDVVGPGEVVSFLMNDWVALPSGRHRVEFSTANDDGVVVERAITRRAGDDGFVTSVSLGAPQAVGNYYRWSMAVGTELAVDGVLLVANLAGFDGTVTVKALGPGGEVPIPGLEAVSLPATGVLAIAIPDDAAALGVPLIVEADLPIIVERALPRSPDLRGRSASLALPG